MFWICGIHKKFDALELEITSIKKELIELEEKIKELKNGDTPMDIIEHVVSDVAASNGLVSSVMKLFFRMIR